MNSPRVLFAGGGSGGHLFPGLAVAEEIRRRVPSSRILFCGPDRQIDRTILSASSYDHECLPLRSPAEAARNPLRYCGDLWRGSRQGDQIVKDFAPDVCVGLGSFASVPLAISALRRRLPVVLLEQNVSPGRATWWLSHRASLVCASFGETLWQLPRRVRTVVTGNPVRRSYITASSASTPPSSPPLLLILGGSYGAAGVNQLCLAALPALANNLNSWQIFHQSGARDLERVQTEYTRLGLPATVAAFVPNLAELQQRATIVISRAGATTLAELACLGKACLLIPLPRAARNHQRANASLYAQAHAAHMIEEGPAAADRLTTILQELLSDPALIDLLSANIRLLARPEATRQVTDCVMQFC